MFHIMLKCLLLTLSICYMVDISGAMQKLNRIGFSLLYGNKAIYNGWFLPLFGCSKCVVFWSCLIYCLSTGDLELIYSISIASLYSYTASILSKLLEWIIYRLSELLDIYN